MLLDVDAAVVCAWSHEPAVGGGTHDNSTGRKDYTSRRDTESGSRGAAHWMGGLVDCRSITRQELGDDIIPRTEPSVSVGSLAEAEY